MSTVQPGVSPFLASKLPLWFKHQHLGVIDTDYLQLLLLQLKWHLCSQIYWKTMVCWKTFKLNSLVTDCLFYVQSNNKSKIKSNWRQQRPLKTSNPIKIVFQTHSSFSLKIISRPLNHLYLIRKRWFKIKIMPSMISL